MLNKEEIKKIIPHREPFLLIDEVIHLNPGESAYAKKYVSIDEDFFRGHFPQKKVMPGVLIVEALAQTGAVAVLSMPENNGKIAYFGGVKNCRFKKMVLPKDTLLLEVTLIKMRGPVGVGKAVAKVLDDVVCECEITFVISK